MIYNVHIAIASLGDISNFTAINNTIYDAFVGAGVLFTPGALVAENYIHNSFVALAIYNCVGSDIIFENNTLKDNNIGVQITASNYTIVRNNIVDNSSDAALYFVTEDADDSYYNLIYNNKFTNSTNFQLMD